MNLHEYRVLFLTVTGILTLIVASPALSRLLYLPRTEFLTELWILDSNHRTSDYPSNVTRNQDYRVYLGIGNRLGYCAYYFVEVKFRNQTQSAPTNFGPLANRTPSSLPSLANITAFVADETVWETPLTFSFDYGYNRTLSRVESYNLTLNNVKADMRDYTITWDPKKKGFFGYLFFELWIYNASTNSFRYHERFVGLRFNMTLN